MATQTHAGVHAGAFPEFGPGDRLRLVRRKMLGIGQAELAHGLGVTTQALSAWEAGRNEGGITAAVALRLEMLTGRAGTAAFVLGVLPLEPLGLPRMDSNHQPPGLRHALPGLRPIVVDAA